MENMKNAQYMGTVQSEKDESYLNRVENKSRD